MRPGIGGRAELVIRRAVGVTQIVRFENLHRSVVARLGVRAEKRPATAVQFLVVAVRGVAPLARRVGRESDAVHARAVIEALRLDGAVALLEAGREGYVLKGVPIGRTLEAQFEDPPTFNNLRKSLGLFRSLCGGDAPRERAEHGKRKWKGDEEASQELHDVIACLLWLMVVVGFFMVVLLMLGWQPEGRDPGGRFAFVRDRAHHLPALRCRMPPSYA